MPIPVRPAPARALALAAALMAGASPTSGLAQGLAHGVEHGRGLDPDGLLPAPPAHAPAGVCYARVRSAARYGPPPAPGAHWRLSPPPPGAPGPVWCLIVDPAAPAPLLAPERDGWIRVLCDADATPARIARLQRRLQAHGDYAGGFSGRYDAATARAVARFQGERRIDHGGYLSLRTVAALEGGEAYAGAPPFPPPAPLPAIAAVIPPPPPPVVILPAPRPWSPPSPAGRWLTWPGKALY